MSIDIVIVVGLLSLGIATYVQLKQAKPKYPRKRRILAEFRGKDVKFIADSDVDDMRFSIDVIGREGGEDHIWQKGSFIIAKNYIALYKKDDDIPIIHVPINSFRGRFYTNAKKKPYELWIHIEAHQLWYLIKLQFKKRQIDAGFHELLRVLEHNIPKEITVGFYTQAPFIHFGASDANEVDADDDGWIIGDLIQLFLTPLYLVVLDSKGFVCYKIALKDVDDIQIIKHDESKGIIRLTVNGAYHTFSLVDYRRWLQTIRQAVGVVLEAKVK